MPWRRLSSTTASKKVRIFVAPHIRDLIPSDFVIDDLVMDVLNRFFVRNDDGSTSP
jgi:hypothetical protein